MAENWGERLAQVGRNLNPVTRVRNMFSGLRDHPMQTIGTGLLTLLGGAVAGPIGAQIGRAGSQYAFNQYNIPSSRRTPRHHKPQHVQRPSTAQHRDHARHSQLCRR